MTGAASRPRRTIAVLASVLGLVVWALHFALVYAVNALACERDWAGWRPFGLPWVPVAILVLTIGALAALGLLLRAARGRLAGSWIEGGEAEPGFTAWLAAAAAGYSALAVLFQAMPALLVPACG
jgi:hypothetical protein